MTEYQHRGWVRIDEFRGTFVLAWYEEERPDAVHGDSLERVALDSPEEALSWARERAPVVVIARETVDRRFGDFSAGARPPRWSPDLAPLNEEAMVAGSKAPWPDVGEFVWTQPGRLDEEALADGGLQDRQVDWSALPEIAVTGFNGTGTERVQRVLGALSAAPTETELRVALAHQGIGAGDNHLLDAESCEHVLYPLLDFADGRRLLAYLLMQVSSEGLIRELQLIEMRLTLTF